MYLSHFGLKEKPFQISTNPKFLWLSEKHKEALAILKYGIIDNRGFLLLTGDVGTGKTTLIHSMINSLEETTLTAIIPDPGLAVLDFYNFIANEFHLNKEFSNKASFLVQFKKFLNDSFDQNKKVLLIVDEAQRLSQELLEEIRLLSNIEKQQTKLMNIFFVGQNDFNNELLKIENRAIRQRITLNYSLEPLSEDETVKFIHHRLNVAGAGDPIFKKDAIKKIHFYTKGFPRLINIICDHSLLTAYVQDKKTVGSEIVMECVNELRINPAPTVQRESAPIKPAPPPIPPPEKKGPTINPPKKQPQKNRDRAHPPEKQQKSTGLAYFLFTCLLILVSIIGGYHYYNGKLEKSLAEIKIFLNNYSKDQEFVSPEYDNNHLLTNNTSDKKSPESKSHESAIGNDRLKNVVQTKASGHKEIPEAILKPKQNIPQSTKKNENSSLSAPTEKTKKDVAQEGLIITLPSPKNLPSSSGNTTAEKKQLSLKSYKESLVAEDRKLYSRTVSGEVIPILFIHNSNDLSPSSYKNLSIVSEIMSRLPDSHIEIMGHTDNVGSAHYNKKLSEFRANIVKSYIIGKGVPPSRVKAYGLGSAYPIASNETINGRRINRRVEIKLLFDRTNKKTSG